jgi:hypothetical protein
MARIANLQDLQAEKLRIAAEISIHKAVMREEIRRLKRQINPISRLLDFLGIGKDAPPTPPILKAGANLGIDLLGHKILAKAGWVTRLAVPLIAKGLSSTFLGRLIRKKTTVGGR